MNYKQICDAMRKYEIADLQNHPAHENRDVMTICGFMQTEAQIEAHAASLKVQAAAWEAKHTK